MAFYFYQPERLILLYPSVKGDSRQILMQCFGAGHIAKGLVMNKEAVLATFHIRQSKYHTYVSKYKGLCQVNNPVNIA